MYLEILRFTICIENCAKSNEKNKKKWREYFLFLILFLNIIFLFTLKLFLIHFRFLYLFFTSSVLKCLQRLLFTRFNVLIQFLIYIIMYNKNYININNLCIETNQTKPHLTMF